MGKPFREIKMISYQPHGPITDAPRPVAVIASVAWTIAPERAGDCKAWALAWTVGEVLVYVLRTPEGQQGELLWLRARDVRRP